MKRPEAFIYTPAAIAILIAAASVATFESGSRAPARPVPAAIAPAPSADAPLIGEITVTATPIAAAAAADLRAIADAARV